MRQPMALIRAPIACEASCASNSLDANGNFDPTKMAEARRKQELDRLVKAGFHAGAGRVDRCGVRRNWRCRPSRPSTMPSAMASQLHVVPIPTSTLRKEMGDAEYEKYLAGTGSSDQGAGDGCARKLRGRERSGLKPGDQIVSYAGQRVFDTGDLNSLTRQGTPGETVTVEVQRDGQTVQLPVPRGVLGVQAGGGGASWRRPGRLPGWSAGRIWRRSRRLRRPSAGRWRLSSG